MPFPVLPLDGQDERHFRVDDPFGLRRLIVPLFESAPNNLLNGLGTAFKVSAEGAYLTAQHVLEQFASDSTNFDHEIWGILGMGLAYGTVRMPPECIVRVRRFFTLRGQREDPVAQLQGRVESQNVFDCLQLYLHRTPRESSSRERLPLGIVNSVVVGDRVLAVGYPHIQTVENARPNGLARYSEQMFGSFGTVIDLHPHGRGPASPWPTMVVAANWHSGMSGGPIFNEAGNVVGIVSSSHLPMDGTVGTGFGFWFEPIAPFFRNWLLQNEAEALTGL